MFDTAAIAAKSRDWPPIRPRMSRSARTRSLAVPPARRRDMPRSYAARSASELVDAGMQLLHVALGFGLHQDAAQDPCPAGVGGDSRVTARERTGVDSEGGQEDRARWVLHAVGEHPGGGLVDRGQAGRGGGREVAHDVELRVLVEPQPARTREHL